MKHLATTSMIAMLLVAVATESAPAQEIISVHFNESRLNDPPQRRPMLPEYLAGAPGVRVNNWNDLPSRSGSQTFEGVDLMFADGSTVGGPFLIETESDRGTQAGTTDNINDVRMFEGHFQMRNNESVTVTLTDVPFDSFDLYVYWGGPAQSNRGGSLSLDDGANVTTHYARGSGINMVDEDGNGYQRVTNTSYDVNDIENTVPEGGNYSLFEGLTNSTLSFTVTGLDMGDTSTQRNHLSGFQIVEASAAVLVGDMNFDGVVDTADVAPFVQALTDPSGYQTAFGVDEPKMIAAGDINGDGAFDTADVAPFVQLLVGGGAASVPEPTTGLLLLGGAILLARRRRG